MSGLYASDFGSVYWIHPSAVLAADRLRWITRRDREACGDGRWVRTVAWFYIGAPLLPVIPVEGPKPHYRWEPRR